MFIYMDAYNNYRSYMYNTYKLKQKKKQSPIYEFIEKKIAGEIINAKYEDIPMVSIKLAKETYKHFDRDQIEEIVVKYLKLRYADKQEGD